MDELFDFNPGGTGNTSSPADSFSTGMNDLFAFDKINGSAPKGITYNNRDSAELLTAQKDYNPYAFNPGDPVNFERLAAKETFGSALMKGLDSFSYKFGNTFVDYWKDYGRMASALVHMDWGKMMPDEETMLQQYYRDQMDMQKNHVFVAPEDEDGIFNKRFLSEFVGNAGFALGTFAGLAVELTADALIAGLSGGSGSGIFAATAARLGLKKAATQGAKTAAKSGYIMDDVLKGLTKAGQSADEIAATGTKTLDKIQQAATTASRTKSATENIVGNTFQMFTKVFDITKSKSLGDLGKRIVDATPILGTGVDYGRKIAAGSKAGLKGGELFGMGLQGVRRMAQELNMSSTEASFEAVSSYGDTLNELVSEFQRENGRPPSDLELDRMESLALGSASGNYNTNMAILLATNQLQFGNLFNKFSPSNRYMRELIESADPTTLTVGTKALTQVYKKGMFGTTGLTGQIAKDFGKKEAAYQLTKSFLKNTAKFEISEGIQENLQETSASAWKNYYLAKNNHTALTLSDAFELGLEEQFTKQGFKTFLMGAMTGMIVSGPTRMTNVAIESLNNKITDAQYKDPKDNPRLQHQENFQKNLDQLNLDLKAIAKGKFEDKSFNFANQTKAAVEQTEAASKNLEYEFQNAKDDAFISAVVSAKKTGSVKALTQAIRNMGETMSAEEFEASFGVTLADTKYNSPAEFANSMAQKMDQYSENYDNIKKSVGKMIDPFMFEKGSRNQYVAGLMRQTQEDAVEIIATDMMKGNLSAERAKQIATEIRNIQGLSNSADTALRTLSEGRFTSSELGLVEAEISQLEKQIKQVTDRSLKKDLNARKKLLTKKQALLSEWLTYFEGSEVIVTDKETGAKSNQGMKYGRFIGEKTTKQVTEKDAEGKETTKNEESFNPKSKKAKTTFKKLVNLLNEEAGVTDPVSEKSIQEGFDKYADYLQLDQDVRDYMSSVEALSDPDNMIQMLERMVDGNFMFRIQMALDRMEQDKEETYRIGVFQLVKNNKPEDFDKLLKDIHELYVNLPEFKKLLERFADPSLSFSDAEEMFKLVNEVGKKFHEGAAALLSKYDVKDYKETPGVTEYHDFKVNGTVTDERMKAIAEDILDNPDTKPESLLDKYELEMYNAKKAEIDAMVANLKQARNEKEKGSQKPESGPISTEPPTAPEPDTTPTPETPPPPAPPAPAAPAAPTPEPTGFDLIAFADDLLRKALPEGVFPMGSEIANLVRAISDAHESHRFEDQIFFEPIDEWVNSKGKKLVADLAKKVIGTRPDPKPEVPEVKTPEPPKAPTSMADVPGATVLPKFDLERLNKELVEIEQQALQNPENLRNFVEEGTSLETQALNYLNDILTCGK